MIFRLTAKRENEVAEWEYPRHTEGFRGESIGGEAVIYRDTANDTANDKLDANSSQGKFQTIDQVGKTGEDKEGEQMTRPGVARGKLATKAR